MDVAAAGGAAIGSVTSGAAAATCRGCGAAFTSADRNPRHGRDAA